MTHSSTLWQISGCSPEISRGTWWYDVGMEGTVGEGEPKAGPLVEKALRSLMSDDEKEGQDAITVIGMTDNDGKIPHEPLIVAKEAVIDIPDSKISVQPASLEDDEFWDFGSVRPLGDNPDNDLYTVSYRGNIMVQKPSLEILRLATDGNLTPRRFWRLAMACGKEFNYVIPNIDYGKMHELDVVWKEDPSVVPDMEVEEVIALEELGEVDKIKDEIIHRGCFWVWMRPDW